MIDTFGGLTQLPSSSAMLYH